MKNALLLVDIQNDFLPGGSLAVKDGNEILPVINNLLKLPFDTIVATKDWHPANHGSFAVNHSGKEIGDQVMLNGLEQILWPVHCVQETSGSEFHPSWNSHLVHKVIYKGTDPKIDSYSTFFDNGHFKSTGLEQYFKEKKVDTVYIAGLATDYCVKFSVLDALKVGLKVYVIVDACRGVNLHPTDSEKAIEEMQKAGARIIHSEDLAHKMAS